MPSQSYPKYYFLFLSPKSALTALHLMLVKGSVLPVAVLQNRMIVERKILLVDLPYLLPVAALQNQHYKPLQKILVEVRVKCQVQ